MNDKRAKALRRQAREMTPGAPRVTYARPGKQLLLGQGCTRYVYKRLKVWERRA